MHLLPYAEKENSVLGVKDCVQSNKNRIYYLRAATHHKGSYFIRKQKMDYMASPYPPCICPVCLMMNGKILPKDDPLVMEFPIHPNCKCTLDTLMAIAAGTATNAGASGVDWYIAVHGRLPDNYLTQKEAKKLGWKKALGNLDVVLPGKLIGGDIYRNWDGRLPTKPGRTWYEADFDYTGGYRNNCRLLFSNDGLLFVTYDHYLTFFEVGLEALQ